MAFRINKAIVRGEITNEVPGIVTGRIWLLGWRDPLVLQLEGNCRRDLAGCALSFSNPHPEPQILDGLECRQTGTVGEMTASRKARIPTVSEEELLRLLQADAPVPSRFANCLYLEWFSSKNGRVVLETECCHLSISDACWLLPRDDASPPHGGSAAPTRRPPGFGPLDDETHDTFDLFQKPDGEFPPRDEDDAYEPDSNSSFEFPAFTENETPLDEFEWEQELRAADQRVEAYENSLDPPLLDFDPLPDLCAETEQFPTVYDTFIPSLDPPKDPLSEYHDSSDEDEFEDGFEDDDEGFDPESDFGIDEHHPLTEHAMDLALLVQKKAELDGLLDDESAWDTAAGEGDDMASPIHGLVRQLVQLGGGLAAALDGISNGCEPENGFIIAMLKRSLVPLNGALQCCADGDEKFSHRRPTVEWIADTRRELFDIRRDVLAVMTTCRQNAPDA